MIAALLAALPLASSFLDGSLPAAVSGPLVDARCNVETVEEANSAQVVLRLELKTAPTLPPLSRALPPNQGAVRLGRELKTAPAHCCPEVAPRLELKTAEAHCCPEVALRLELKTVPARC